MSSRSNLQWSLLKSFKIIFLFIGVVVCAYSVRNFCCQREIARIKSDSERLGERVNFVPFLVESSMMYSYACDVASGEGIPEFDDKLVGMSNVGVNQQFTTGLEYVLGYSYRLKNLLFGASKLSAKDTQFEDDPVFAKWCRVQIRIWGSIVSGLIFLWLIALRMPVTLALFGGLLHAVAPSAIARYTGQDIVRGNFALPLIIGTFVLAYFYLGRPKIWKLIATGIVAFLALATWDMTQICFAIWGLSEIVRLACKASSNSVKFSKRNKLWLTLFVATLLVALTIPYHRTHLLIVSPLMVIVFPVIFAMQFFGRGELKRRLTILTLSVTGFYFLWHGIISLGSFASNYGHFASLMKAKIQFFNIKPSNPDLLNFDARSIWVPAMHSANKKIVYALFPIVLNITVLTLILTLWIKKIRRIFLRQMGLVNFPLFMFVFYGIGFFLIVRYHVFAIIFMSILLPLLLNLWGKNAYILSKKELWKTAIISIIYFTVYAIYFHGVISPKVVIYSALLPTLTLAAACGISFVVTWLNQLIRREDFSLKTFMQVFIVIVAIFVLMSELDRTIYSHRRYQQNFFAEVAGLIKWMRTENMENEIIMADFDISPLLKAYCKTKIVLQPKFEIGKTRENYRRFMNIMFHGTEKELADFCEEQNARIFIFDRGYPASKGIYSPRYIAAAVHEIEPESPANMMYLNKNRVRLRNFYEIKPPASLKCINNRYIIFQVITKADKKRSERWIRAAENELKHNNLRFAARLARSAIFADPLSPEAYLLCRKFFRYPPRITLRGY